MPEVVRGFPGPGVQVVGPAVEARRLEAYLVEAVADAAAVGARILVFDAGVSRVPPAGFAAPRAWDQLRRFLSACAKLARRHRLKVAIEPRARPEADLIHSLEEAWLLAHEVGEEGIATAANLSHLHREREPYDALIVAETSLVHVHVEARDAIGTGGDGPDYREAFGAQRAARYGGRVSVGPGPDVASAEAAKLLSSLRTVAGVGP